MKIWENYLNSLTKQQRIAVINILNLALKYIDNPQESISYGMPTIKYKSRPVIAVAANKNHLGVYPFGSEAILTLKNILKEQETSKGAIRFKYDNLPTGIQIKAIVDFKIKQIEEQLSK